MTFPNPRPLRSPFVARGAGLAVALSLLSSSCVLRAGTFNDSFAYGDTQTSPLPSGATFGSSNAVARILGGRFRLTANGTGGSAASLRLPVLDPGFEISEFTMDFDLRLFETAGGSNPADGFSINFGAVPTTASDYGPGEEGWGLTDGLVIAFDTWDNGGEPPAIEAKADGTAVRNVALSAVAPGGNFLNLFDNVSRHMTIHWDANGLDITYAGMAIMSNIPTPGFVPAVGNYFAFSGRTGGATEDVFFDNLVVTTTPVTPIQTGGPVLTEVLSVNEDTRVDEDCEPGAWIEIYNGQAASANLSGWRLTDDAGNLSKWTIPAINLPGYGHAFIWADGKNRMTAPNYHANFALNPAGGYVALVRPNSTIASAFNYGPGSEDIAYGTLGQAQTLGYLETPSPGSKNSGIQSTAPPPTEDVEFNRTGGLITGPVNLNILPPVTPGAVVRYSNTNDPPTAASPVWPAGGLTINNSTNIRARIFVPNALPGPVNSRVFLLLDSTLTNYRGSGQAFRSNLPIIVFHSFGNNIDGSVGSPGLRSFRYSYAITLDRDPTNGNRAVITGPIDYQGRSGVHVRGETSAGFPQRPYSWETWDNRDGDKDESILGLSADSDWALISNYNDKAVVRNKQPFDTMFDLDGEGSAMREKYVEVFYRQDSATGPVRWQDYRGIYCLTERIKRHDDRVNIDKLEPCDNVLTGNPAVDDQAVISGGYIFRKDKDPQINPFSIGSYGGFQVYEPDPPTTNQLNYISGYMSRFNTALNGAGFADPVNGYAKYIDVPSFIDVHLWVEVYKQVDGYRLSSYFYKDRGKKVFSAPLWDYNLCIGNGSPAGGYPTDFELPQGWYFRSNGGSSYPFYNRLFQDSEFTLKYWDRYWQLRRSLFTPTNAIALIEQAVNELSDNNPNAVITNGSGGWPNNTPSMDIPIGRHHGRWQRLGVYDWPNMTNSNLRTRWSSAVNPATVTATTPDPFQSISEIAFAKVWMLQRLLWMDDQSMTFNSTDRNFKPPYFNQYGGQVNSGFQLVISNPNAGSPVLYVTTNGTDPRAGAPPFGGTTLTLTQTTNVKARFREASGLWSPLTDALFVLNTVPASASNIVISEMHYNPLPPTPAEIAAGVNNANDFEWIEILNISSSAVDLTNCRFIEGVTFNWFDAPAGVQTLGPSQRMIICENLAAFNLRHGSSGANVAGAFVGNLGNAGEAIRFVDRNDADIKYFVYDDDPPWPEDADGGEFDQQGNRISGGYSLVLNNPTSNPDHNIGTNWRSSASLSGAPGQADSTPFTGSPTADTDRDGSTDLVEYACGSNPNNGNQAHVPTTGWESFDVGGAVGTHLTFSFLQNLRAEGVTSTPEVSSNLSTWQNASVSMTFVRSVNNGDGTATLTWRSTLPAPQLPPRIFGRLRVTMP